MTPTPGKYQLLQVNPYRQKIEECHPELVRVGVTAKELGVSLWDDVLKPGGDKQTHHSVSRPRNTELDMGQFDVCDRYLDTVVAFSKKNSSLNQSMATTTSPNNEKHK
jgi:hypothetical protein